LVYGFPVDQLLPRFKFHGDLAAGRVLAELFVRALPPRAMADWPQALVPVPLHPARLRQRGYDQALEVARTLSRLLSLPLGSDGLHRRRATSAQSELGARARRRNVRGAFVRGDGALPAHVALIDDVMTTGATVNECAQVLKQSGVKQIEIWVLARAPRSYPAKA
jgi:ComF family protein